MTAAEARRKEAKEVFDAIVDIIRAGETLKKHDFDTNYIGNELL
jgi:hypothetical protein